MHTWYLSFFYIHTFSGLEILHSKVRKFATKIASRQNSVNQYWEVKFTFSFLAATFDHEIMKQGTNVLFVCTGIVSFEVILFLHISESLSRPPRSSALLPFAKQLLPPGEGWPSRPNLGQPKRIHVPWVLGFMALGYMARKSMVAIETKTMATSLLNFELSSLSMWRMMTMGFSNVSSSYLTCSLGWNLKYYPDWQRWGLLENRNLAGKGDKEGGAPDDDFCF